MWFARHVLQLRGVLVQHELKYRKIGDGREFHDTEQAGWLGKTMNFFQKRDSETAAEKKKRLKYTVVAKPRLATLHWLQDMSNALRGLGKSWHFFGGQDGLLSPETPLRTPKFIIVCTDQEATQPGALNYLRWAKGIWTERVLDP